ncbi:helix-turn-helix transcriptional regulator [Streptomyces sp. NPDC002055]|uniref:helix-turn-helix domain-containing protein n=1 Tax=Streptomyces sp. NPDC002055 TaxID=3154534 RepID=UPI0033267800
MTDALTIGDRLAALRMRRGTTQEQLAERARLSVDTVRKLEQNQRRTARLATLNALARALDVETSVLVGQPTVLEPANGADPPSLLALRRAVTPLAEIPGLDAGEDDVPPPSLAQLRASLRSTELVRRRGEFTRIASVLPVLIADARAAVRALTGAERASAQAVLAEAYQVAATTLAGLGKEDAAFTAIEHSVAAARLSDDPRLETMAISCLSWIFTKQGRIDDAERVAVATAERIEPGFRSAPVDLSLWGILLLRGATAAVRAERGDTARDLLSLASAAAARIGTDRLDYATPFGPTNAAVAAVNAYVDMGQPGRAIERAQQVRDTSSLPPTWLARHQVDRALAYADLGRDDRAVRALLAADRTAPEWMRYHATSRHLVAELRGRERRRHSPVRDLAMRLHIEE